MVVWEAPVTLVIPAYILIVALGAFLVYKLTKDKTKKVSSLRLFIQVAAVVGIFMGLIIGPFNQPLFLPLGPSPRQNLLGANFLGNQFPDGISFPALACYYPNGRTVTCPIWQLQAYIFPFWNLQRGYDVVYSTSGLRKTRHCHRYGGGCSDSFRKILLRLAMPAWLISRCNNTNPQSHKN